MDTSGQSKQWFVLRDFKKWNAKNPGYLTLPKLGIKCFTPMHWIVSTRREVKKRELVPVIRNLLFAFDTKETLQPIVDKDSSLQFQFQRGGGSAAPMIVPAPAMERFIHAVDNDPSPVYFRPDELSPDMYGKKIIIHGGPLDGYEGKLLKMQGSKKKRLIVELPDFFAAAVEVNPEYIQFV